MLGNYLMMVIGGIFSHFHSSAAAFLEMFLNQEWGAYPRSMGSPMNWNWDWRFLNSWLLVFLQLSFALSSRKFQNEKFWLDFVEIWSFYCHSDFMWNQILAYSNGLKLAFLASLETEFWNLVHLGLDERCSNLPKIKIQNL